VGSDDTSNLKARLSVAIDRVVEYERLSFDFAIDAEARRSDGDQSRNALETLMKLTPTETPVVVVDQDATERLLTIDDRGKTGALSSCLAWTPSDVLLPFPQSCLYSGMWVDVNGSLHLLLSCPDVVFRIRARCDAWSDGDSIVYRRALRGCCGFLCRSRCRGVLGM